MAERGEPPPAAAPERRDGGGRARWVLLAFAAALAALLVVVAATALPRWWAQRVGDQVDGSLATGLWLGFMYGLLATVLPLLVLAAVWRFLRRRPAAWGIGIAVAAVLAAPNLLTLWIVVGSGDAAHAGDRTLDVEAPWFRGGMLIGVLAGLAATAFLLWALAGRRRARADARGLRKRLRGPGASGPPDRPSA